MSFDLKLITKKELETICNNFKDTLDINSPIDILTKEIHNISIEYNIDIIEDLNTAISLYKKNIVMQRGCCFIMSPSTYETYHDHFNLPPEYNTSNIERGNRIIRMIKQLSVNDYNFEFSGSITDMCISNDNKIVVLDSNGNIFYKTGDFYTFINLPTTYFNTISLYKSNMIIKLKVVNNTFYVLDNYGSIYGWGENNNLLNNNSTKYLETPKKIMFCNTLIINFFAGNNHIIAIDNINKLYGWGSNKYYQLLYKEPDYQTSINLDLNINVEFIVCGDTFNVILNKTGTLYSWGDNSYGQLGDNTYKNHDIPQKIYFPNKIRRLVGGRFHIIVIDEKYDVYVWGLNDKGQLGIGNLINKNHPHKLLSDTNIVDIFAGDNHSLFLLNDGSVYGCGDNSNNQLRLNNSEYISQLTKLELEPIEQIYTNNNSTFYFTKNKNLI